MHEPRRALVCLSLRWGSCYHGAVPAGRISSRPRDCMLAPGARGFL